MLASETVNRWEESHLTRVLTHWLPDADLSDQSEENRQRVWDEFQELINRLRHPVEVQSVHPPRSLILWYQNNTHWHQDCGPEDAQFIVWSNVQPTEVRFMDGTLIAAEDGAVILINNLEAEHRTPTPLHPDRWLARSEYITIGLGAGG